MSEFMSGLNKANSPQNDYAQMFNNYKANKKNGNENSLVANEAKKSDSRRTSDVFNMDGKEECQSCKNRKYQDRSNDSSVSYQNPTKISSAAAASAVKAHEMEHVRNNQTKAKQEGKEIVSQYVRIKTGICPECGDTYVAGGETVTVTRTVPENNKPRLPEENDAEKLPETQKPKRNVSAEQKNRTAVAPADDTSLDLPADSNKIENDDAEKFTVGKTEVVVGEFLDDLI